MEWSSSYTEDSLDLSYSDLDIFPGFLLEKANDLKSLQLDHNEITVLPRDIGAFRNLVKLDISNNGMSYISPDIVHLTSLVTLNARNNSLTNDAIPKDLSLMQSLQVVNFAGNALDEFPTQILELVHLKALYLGANNISSIPSSIQNLNSLEILYMGGNRLEEIPCELGDLTSLVSLILCDNRLLTIPSSLANLRKLQSLSLHNNSLSTLPPEIVNLNLVELSLRNNPLVVRFVHDMNFNPPSLLELSGRIIKQRKVPYAYGDVPTNLVEYLDSSHQCVNPKCKGVFFTSHVQHVKFVDFCGKYRLPLLEYLCSPNCKSSATVPYTSSSESDSEDEVPPMVSRMKRVLLG